MMADDRAQEGRYVERRMNTGGENIAAGSGGGSRY
jgi:hypothetical protein